MHNSRTRTNEKGWKRKAAREGGRETKPGTMLDESLK